MDSSSQNKNRLQLKYNSGAGHLRRSTYLMRNTGLNYSLDRYYPALHASRAKKAKALHSDPSKPQGSQQDNSAVNVGLNKSVVKQPAQQTEPAGEDDL